MRPPLSLASADSFRDSGTQGGNTVSGELLPNTNVKTGMMIRYLVFGILEHSVCGNTNVKTGTMISTWYCQIPNTKFQISNTNVKTRMMISTGIVKENMKPALDANIKLNLCKAVCMSRTNASGGVSIFLPSGLSWWVGCPLVRVMADGSCLLS